MKPASPYPSTTQGIISTEVALAGGGFTGIDLMLDNTGKVEPDLSTTVGSARLHSAGTLSLDKWHHVVMVCNGADINNWKMYIDGRKAVTGGLGNTLASSSNKDISNGVGHLRIGSHYGGNNGSAYFNGKVKQVRLYGRAIKEEEIQLSYDGGCGADPEDKSQLVLWLPLNEKTGTTVHDLSSYGLTATTSNPYFEEIRQG